MGPEEVTQHPYCG